MPAQSIKLLALAGPLCCMVSTSCGVATLTAFGAMAPDQAVRQWCEWWIGDMFGVIVFLPLMIIAPGSRKATTWRGYQLKTLSATALLAVMLPLARARSSSTRWGSRYPS